MPDPQDIPDPHDDSGAHDDRREQLIAAAVAESLSPEERAELAVLTATDPSIDLEIAELRDVVGRMSRSAPAWDASAPDATLRDRVLGLGGAENDTDGEPRAPRTLPVRTRPTRRGFVLGLAAAACLLFGGVAGVLGTLAATTPTQVAGPPGTLGAVEEVDFVGEPSGVVVTGAIVAHTWGTETFLEIDGLPAGDTYDVVLVDVNGERVPSGSFLGSTVTIDCRMNAATLRPDVQRVEIVDATGRTIASTDLPDVA